MIVNCAYCSKELERIPSRATGRNYCNPTCQIKYEYENGLRDKKKIILKAREQRTKKSLEKFNTNPTTKISKRGYKMIYIPFGVMGQKRSYVKEHHYVWEQHNGKVPEGMVVHHKNFNRLDNRMENLILMNSKEHLQLHYAKRVIDKYGRFV